MVKVTLASHRRFKIGETVRKGDCVLNSATNEWEEAGPDWIGVVVNSMPEFFARRINDNPDQPITKGETW